MMTKELEEIISNFNNRWKERYELKLTKKGFHILQEDDILIEIDYEDLHFYFTHFPQSIEWELLKDMMNINTQLKEEIDREKKEIERIQIEILTAMDVIQSIEESIDKCEKESTVGLMQFLKGELEEKINLYKKQLKELIKRK
jgi:hypothetical protein